MNKSQILTGLKTGSASVVLGMALVASPGFAQTNSTQPEATGQQSTNSADQQNVAPAGPAEQVPNPANANGDTSQSAATTGGDIVVTGSRIPQPNLTAVSPVTVINSQEFKLSGTTRTEDLVNSLPQVFAAQGGQVSNAATGTATLDLRDLGDVRTLVLVNGRRLGPGDPTSSAADINFIPAALIKRVDVLTGGASSTYGADAVGGVVNFIMDTDFTGFKLDSQYSFYNHDNGAKFLYPALNARGFGYPDGQVADGGTVDATGVIGASFDDNRGHVVAYAGYRRIEAVLQANRDYSACAVSANTAGTLSCGGSGTSPNGRFLLLTGGTANDTVTFKNANGTTTTIAAPYANGTTSSFQATGSRAFRPGFTPYNYGPTNYFQRPDERYTAGFYAHYDVDPAFKPYLEGMFMDDRSVAQIAPSGDFGNTYSINCDNPLLSAQQYALVCGNPGNLITASVVPGTGFGTGNALQTTPPTINSFPTTVTSSGQGGNPLPAYQFVDPTTGQRYTRGFLQVYRRNVEGGPRQDDLEHTDYHLVFGARGDLNKAFSYDAYYQYNRTNFAETYLNDVSITRLQRALDVVRNPNTGAIQCRSAVDGTDPNCVPYDIFSTNNVSPAAVAYLSTPGFQRGQVSEQVASVNVTGLLGQYGIKSPWANDGVGINIGGEFRRESLNLNTDLEFQTGDLSGQGAATLPVNGAFNVYEGFGEIRIPIVQQGFIYDASFDGGYRYSHYEVGNRSYNTNTYKLGGEIAPIRAIRFRGAYNRAVRSPNIQEFFAPQRVALDGSTDPCAGVVTAAQVGCQAQGLRVGQTVVANPAGQYNGLIGGNPNLTPEKADTYTAGIVLQPDFVPFLRGLAVTVDYFNIKVKNIVTGIGADTILSQCNTTVTPFCALIHRDGSGSIWRSPQGYVIDTTQNLGSLRTKGIDVGASYAHEIGSYGSLSLNFNGTYLDDLTKNNGVSTPYDCSGLYGSQCGTPAPHWRHKARATFTLPDGIGISGQWRYFGPVSIDKSSDNPTLSGAYSAFASRIQSQSYFDLALTGTIAEHYNLRVGVQNLLDRDPPTVSGAGAYACPAGFCNGNTYPVVYDALGRYIYAGVTLNF